MLDTLAHGAGQAALTTTAATALTVSAVTVPELTTGTSLFADRPSTFFSDEEAAGERPSQVARTLVVPAGKVGRLAFEADAGDRVFVELRESSVGPVTLTLEGPDGASIASTYAYPYLDTTPLEAAGRYTVLVDPWQTTASRVALRVIRVPRDEVAVVRPTGSTKPVTLRMTSGQNAEVRFRATAGERIFVELVDSTTGTTTLSLKGPDGKTLDDTYAYPYLDTTPLRRDVTYSVGVDPWGSNEGRATVRVLRVPPDAVATVRLSRTATPVRLRTRGRPERGRPLRRRGRRSHRR